jgi:hypothetical protein
MRAGIALVCTIILLPAVHAAATPYYIAYEADTPGVFPEDVGWERLATGGGADRTIAGGILRLSADVTGISDVYKFDGNEQLNPDPGEFFFAEWRMRIISPSDVDITVYFTSDDFGGIVSMGWGENDFWSFADGNHLQLDATVFHTYRLVSLDMLDYEFYLDGEPAYQGFFDPPTLDSSFVLWGDGGVNGISTSEWDYFRLGVVPVPAPSALWMLLSGAGGLVLMRGRRTVIQ